MAEKDWIARYFAPLATAGARGMHDDVGALGRGDGWQLATVDALVEGVHFLPDDTLTSVAKKLVRVNVSDILAKGAHPKEALLTLGWPSSRSEEELAEFAASLSEELADWGIGLVGGDTVSSPMLFLSLTMIGCPSVSGAEPIWQDGANAGDVILLSGRIGGCIGLEDAIVGKPTTAAIHYRTPMVPPLEAAGLVSQYASAATDISDGLLSDLSQLLERSHCGALVELEQIRLWRESKDLEEILRQCTGGDDYQIVCTATPANAENLIKTELFYQIGQITGAEGLRIQHNGASVNLPETTGFEHGA